MHHVSLAHISQTTSPPIVEVFFVFVKRTNRSEGRGVIQYGHWFMEVATLSGVGALGVSLVVALGVALGVATVGATTVLAVALLGGGVANVGAAAVPVSAVVASVVAFRLEGLFLIAGQSRCLQSALLRQVELCLHGANLVSPVDEFFIFTRRGLQQLNK